MYIVLSDYVRYLNHIRCEALPGVAYPGVRDNRSTINTKTGYDDDRYSSRNR